MDKDEFGFEEIFEATENTQPESETEQEEEIVTKPESVEEEENGTEPPVTDDAEEETEEGGDESEEEKPVKPALSEEQRRKNAARRREQEKSAEKAANNSEIAKLGLKNPYRDNKPITTFEEMREYNADKAIKEAERDIKSNGLTDENVRKIVESDPTYQKAQEIIQQSQRDALNAQIDAQYAQIKQFDKDVPSLEDLLNGEHGEELREMAGYTHDLFKAYKAVFAEDIINRRAVSSAKEQFASAGSGKEHMRSTSTRGAGAPTVTQADIDRFRALDPTVTVDEIRDFMKRDANRIKH